MSNLKDMTGLRKGRLVVLRRLAGSSTTASWVCQCDCGKKYIATGPSLRRSYKGANSCGCLRKPSVRSAFKVLAE